MFTVLALSAHHGNSEAAAALSLIASGLIVLIVGLLAVYGIFSLVGKWSQRGQPVPPASPTPAAPAAVPAAVPAQVAAAAVPAAAPVPGVHEHIAALLAAAVHMALDGKAHRIIRIEPSSGGWAREGRREIFSSHRLR